MGTVLKGATVIELEPASVEVADLRIEGGQIIERGASLAPRQGDEVIDLKGKVVMPGLVSAHHHLYGTLLRGMPLPQPPPEDFAQWVAATSWRLDQALDGDAVHAAATAGALEALNAGTTTIFDQHSSPRAIEGSLTRVARGVNEVGLRGVLSYEVTDRHGAVGREEGLDENTAFIRKAQGRFRGMVGAHACYTLGNGALEGLHDVVESTGAPLHIQLAEDPTDERQSIERYEAAPLQRLLDHKLIDARTVIAHLVHLSWPQLSQTIATGAWLVHAPRSNMERGVGYAPAGKFGARGTLGTAGLSPDLFAEAQLAHLRSRDAGQPIDPLHYLANGHRLASELFGLSIGPMRAGSAADLLVLDYRPPTPLGPHNLAAHFLHGFSARLVESVMVDGVWRLWARRPLSVNPDVVSEHARELAHAVWQRAEA